MSTAQKFIFCRECVVVLWLFSHALYKHGSYRVQRSLYLYHVRTISVLCGMFMTASVLVW